VKRSDAPFMTIRETARELQVSTTTAYRLAAAGEIPTVLLRGRRRVPRLALRRWLELQTQRAMLGVRRHRCKAR